MNKMAMGVVALTAVLASPMAMAEDIIVQANETKSITSTPTEQPESAEIHGTLTVSGGAVVLPKTVALGCAAGDNARIELSGSGTRFGEGPSGGSATAFTIGANGGFGTILNDGGNTDMEKGGVGLGSLTVSADAVTAGETLDVLTLKSGYVRTSGMYNDNAKPARLLFAGGALRSGQGWGSELVGRGDFIWESVNGSGVTIDLANYGNSVKIGPGKLTVRGTGNVEFRCSWGDGTSNNGQIEVSEPIVWAGSNNLYLGDNAKFRMFCNDTLPFGSGKGTVTARGGSSKLVFAAVCTQHVNSVTTTGGSIAGKGALVFGADDLDGTLAATIADETDIIKVGSGTLTVSAATAAAKSTLQVDAGTVLVKAPLTLASCSVAAGAHMIVDGMTLTFPAGATFDTSSIECINGGRIVTPIVTAGDGSVKGLCFGGESVLDKSGAGRLTVYEPGKMPATICVNEGGVVFSKFGCTDTFYRWTIRENTGAASGKTLKLGELALFDGTGRWIDWPSPAGVSATKAVADFARGEYQLVPDNLRYEWMIQSFEVTLDHMMEKGNDMVFMHTEFLRTPQESDQATWQVISWRLPEGANSLSSFDVCSGAPGDWGEVGTPISWTFESSPDGTTWKLLHELTAAETIGTREHGHWMSGGDFRSGVSPKEMFELSNYVTKGVVPGRTSYAVEMAAGTTLDVSAADAAGFALDGLTLSLAGGMSIKGAQLAEKGTLTLTDIPAAGLPKEIAIPCTFTDCAGTAGLADWTVVADGRARGYLVAYDAANAVLRLVRKGLSIIVK